MITFRNLEIFEKVASCGKMSSAAAELYISQSAVSQAIVDLEHSYDIMLFERLGKKLYLTDTGEEFLQYTRQLLACRDAMESWLGSVSNAQHLRVGASLTVGSTVLWPILERLRAELPEVELEVCVHNTQTLESMLLRGRLDTAIVEGDISDKSLSAVPIMNDRMVLICGRGHLFWGRKEIDVSELEGQSFVLREEGSGTREQIVKPLEDKNISFKTACVCSNVQAVLRAVEYNLGISYISRLLVEKECAEGKLWAATVKGIPGQRLFYLVKHIHKVPGRSLERLYEICGGLGC